MSAPSQRGAQHRAHRQREAPRRRAGHHPRDDHVHPREDERGGLRDRGARGDVVKPVLTPQQANDLDRATQAAGTPAEVLMERAGGAVAQAAIDRCGGVYGRRAVVVCGKGNNGGDGLVAARHLARRGMRVSVIAVEALDELRDPAASNAGRLARAGTDRTSVQPRRPRRRTGASRRRDRRDLRHRLPRRARGRVGRGDRRLNAGRGARDRRRHPVGGRRHDGRGRR